MMKPISGIIVACLTLAGTLLASSADAALVFRDGFEGRAAGSSIAGTLPEIGDAPWAVAGSGSATAAADGSHIALNVQTIYSTGFLPVGPPLGSERWLRLDISSESSAGVVITPQLQTGAETNVVGLPAIWPAASGADAWAVVNTTFAQGAGGSGRPSQLNLDALYPKCDRDKPFHVEVHWKVRGDAPNTADMSLRVWNGDTPPDYAPGATVVYTLAAGTWRAPARSAVSKVGTPSLVGGVSVYDAEPQPVVVTALDPAFSYSGRGMPVGAELHASGAGQRVRFLATGDSCTLLFRCDVDSQLPVSWRVDGGAWSRTMLPAGQTVEVPVYMGASWGPHAVEAMGAGMSGPFWSSDDTRLVFQGVRLSPGGSASPMTWPDHRAVFLGDDTLSGRLVLSGETAQSANAQSDARLAPAALLAHWLGWDITNVSAPGIGFLKPYPGESEPLVARTFLDQMFKGVPWTPPPGVSEVVINLGTNDGDTKTYPDSQLRPVVADYLRDVRAKFPAARIYLLMPFNGARAAALKAAFDEVADPNSQWVDTSASAPGGAWLDRTAGADTTDGLHPNARGNEKVAHRLMTTLGADGAASARLEWPTDGATVSGRVVVRGSAFGADFLGGVLGFGEGDAPTAWRVIQGWQTPVSGSVLGVWDTRALAPGRYSLRLVAGAGDQTATATIRVNVVSEAGSGGPSPVDAATVLKAAAGLLAPAPDTLVRLDVYPVPGTGGRLAGDGRLSMEDALRILRRSAAR